MALVLAPEPPLEEWMKELDEWRRKSPGFFAGRPIILDVSALPIDKDGLAKLVADLSEREVRIMGIEGTKASWLGLGMPPLVSGGKQTGFVDPAEVAVADKPSEGVSIARAKPGAKPPALVHPNSVRSGQSLIFPEGDVTVIGSVASGAEVIAGGSIHVYGALRGRVIAGSTGNAHARIFCSKLEAELVAIDGLYRTADEMEPQFRGRPIQAWLEGDTMTMATLN